jgi:protein-tyrosine-phosphatase
VLARYLYEHLCGTPALSAGLDAGERINDRAERMLQAWGIDASGHRPQTVSRELCQRADAVFVMGPSYQHRLVRDYGADLAAKTYLFADPFTKPATFSRGEYHVADPSFDNRPASQLVEEFAWMLERVVQIRDALAGNGPRLVPLSDYLALCRTVGPDY